VNRQEIFWLFLTSIGFILSFPPFSTGLIAIVVLVPFFFYLRDKDLWRAFKGGYSVGILWTAGTIYWIAWATVFGFLGALLFLPFYFSLYAVVQAWLWKRWGEVSLWAAPFLWVSIELLSSYGVLGFPWNSLAYTQTYTPVLIQYASITGMYGVTFWVVLLNVIFYFLIKNKKNPQQFLGYLILIVVLFVLPLAHGWLSITKKSINRRKIKVALVQGNIDPYKKWTPSFIDSNFAVYRKLTQQAGSHKPDLIVWPETATPCYLRYRLSYLSQVKSQVDIVGVPLLTGSPDYEWGRKGKIREYNAALLIRPDSWGIDRYYKMHLVPFSERVPFVEKMPFLYNWSKKLDVDIGNFSPGDSIVVFKFVSHSLKKKLRFSVVICYESVFPYLVRKFVQKGAQFLVIITNDGWFGKTSGPYQHAQIAVLRAIENGLWVVRCANTGVSEFIDPSGRIKGRLPLGKKAVLTASFSPEVRKTFFVTHGDLFPRVILMISGFILLGSFIRKQKKANSLIKL